MITRITYNSLTAKKQDIYRSDVGNFMTSHQHLAKCRVTMEGNKWIMGKQTCLLYN